MAKRRRKKKSTRIPVFLFISTLIVGGYFAFQYFNKKNVTPIKFNELPSFPEGFKSYGIDISHHQDEVDWDLFSEHNDSTIKFIYCKVSEGVDLTDRQWRKNHSALQRLKLPHGGYHFFRPNSDPEKQAENFLAHYMSFEKSLPPALDVEIEDNSDSELILKMKIWLKIVEKKTGKRPIIYTSYHFYSKKFEGEFDNYKFWIASYSDKSHRLKNKQIIHWQFSEKGKIPGIKGFVDLNYSKIEF